MKDLTQKEDQVNVPPLVQREIEKLADSNHEEAKKRFLVKAKNPPGEGETNCQKQSNTSKETAGFCNLQGTSWRCKWEALARDCLRGCLLPCNGYEYILSSITTLQWNLDWKNLDTTKPYHRAGGLNPQKTSVENAVDILWNNTEMKLKKKYLVTKSVN